MFNSTELFSLVLASTFRVFFLRKLIFVFSKAKFCSKVDFCRSKFYFSLTFFSFRYISVFFYVHKSKVIFTSFEMKSLKQKLFLLPFEFFFFQVKKFFKSVLFKVQKSFRKCFLLGREVFFRSLFSAKTVSFRYRSLYQKLFILYFGFCFQVQKSFSKVVFTSF